MAQCAIFDDPANPPAPPNSAVAFHRIPTLWGIRHTAPYFHDNSAPTLEQAVAHYVDFFRPTHDSMIHQAEFFERLGDPQSLAIAAGLRDMAGALVITDQDVLAIAAYMRLL
jgi:cytochrome c peroxidase